MFKIIFSLIKNKAKLAEWQLQIGAHLIRLGTGYKVGQIIHRPDSKGKKKAMYIKNLFFNFAQNKITYTLDTKPVK